MLAVNSDPRPFAQANDGLVVEVVKLLDARLASFSHVCAAFNGVEVMRVNVEGNPAECIEAWRVEDGHVVSGANANACEVAAGRGAHVGFAGAYCGIDGVEITGVANRITKDKGVPSAGEKTIGPIRSFLRRFKFMCPVHLKPPGFKDLFGASCIGIVGHAARSCKGDE